VSAIVFATKNPGKLRELRHLCDPLRLQVLGLGELAFAPDVVEDGTTFEENALKKARAIASWSGMLTIADDSGLEVDALGGRPGVHSARFAGEHGDDGANIDRVLEELQPFTAPATGFPARFRCVLAMVDPERGREHTTSGACEGAIVRARRGSNGFGYDPIFIVDDAEAAGAERTMAQLSEAEKASVSHRGKALRLLVPTLREWLAR
jgi:XTP/dITP diphosphohydrolase